VTKKSGASSKAKTTPEKRGPGRPPKSKEGERVAPASGMKKRGRPKKEKAQETSIEVTTSKETEPVSMRKVNALVHKLTDFYSRQVLLTSYELGKLVVEELFDGDPSTIHQHGPKENALASLLRHDQLPCSSATLSRAVRVYELLSRLPQFKDHKQLALGHLYAVLPVAEDKQERLLELAVDKKWTAENFQEHIAKLNKKELSGSSRGRPALPEGLKALGVVERLLDKETGLHDLEFVEKLETKQIERMKTVVEEMEAWCVQAKSALERRLGVVEAPSE